ncbi:unnamed protein product [Darwinula stevensoni]|uniref:HIT-type domain-containing protein n=1 Tax=Darwinula stevensoni TaxID=69355 RepID=A0A7R8XAG0_9CRUS|nr:unnamed protein product [Darwinula stevensoni]CAG0883741.1 unnamed protein product [Darwinula stevensoni]
MLEPSKLCKEDMPLDECNVCKKAEGRYKCPACLIHSCSLDCVREHKIQTGCTGIRDKTKFVRLSKFDDSQLFSDFTFLEDGGRVVDGIQRSTRGLVPRIYPNQYNIHSLPHWLENLRWAARKRGTNLRFLPMGFERRRINKTRCRFFKNPDNGAREPEITWHVEWCFDNASCADSLTVFTDESVPERMRLAEAVSKYIDADDGEGGAENQMLFYRSAGHPNIALLLEAEGPEKNTAAYHELDPSLSLRANLRGKTIVEYPRIHVIRKHHLHAYSRIQTCLPDLNQVISTADARLSSSGAIETSYLGCDFEVPSTDGSESE